ncbi:CoA pyrophosphatase [Spongiibacter sp. KMU-158]|uniref:CoA pyrophosphatase n=2 Tax=Spongiibacter pelagi TaxID=2760804 RepID=A0A927GY26_9GAMM|nr:CoA pyrophosphatase [Spongiibacter pelagi]
MQRLKAAKPVRRWWRRWTSRSAVALIIREHNHQLEVLMIRRAEREGDPWSGQMAFPGGRMDPDDRGNGRITAERETLEEVGIDLDKAGHCIGRLSDIIARRHSRKRVMIVTPYVYRLHLPVSIDFNHEVAETVWVPFDFLCDYRQRESMVWQKGLAKYTLPCYFYGERRIWGMSLGMLDELIAVAAFPITLPEK